MILDIWYRKKLPIYLWPLIPLSWIYLIIITIRKKLYKLGIFRIKKVSLPVIIVGNVTVGGTGKTPLVMHIYELLKQRGLRPGIISRGYKGKRSGLATVWVDNRSLTADVGDEAILLFKKLNCPLVVSKNRLRAARRLLDSGQVDVIIADDGLQHYGLARDIEIAVLDGERQFGNGHCLPLGPLREPIMRLNSVDLKVVNGQGFGKDGYDMELKPLPLHNAVQPNFYQELIDFRDKTVHAVAGIGHPERFFQMLRNYHISVIPHAFPDHYFFRSEDIHFKDNLPVIMTEKDAVKCKELMTSRHWILPVRGVLNPLFDARLVVMLQEVMNG